MGIALRSKQSIVLVLFLVLDLFQTGFRATVILGYEDEYDGEDELLILASL
jgi:hypothetical protein